jgi:poly(3-hydroxybutyrate) depolymerase
MTTMKSLRISFARIGFTLSLCLPISIVQAQPATNPGAAPQPGRGAGFGLRGGRGQGLNARVQNRTYTFTNTDETMPYEVFISSKVSKETNAPLIVALHGMGGNPGTLMRGNTLQLAEEGGYIVVAPMGYNSSGWYGMPMSPGGRGRSGRGAPTAAPQTQATNSPAATQAARGRGGAAAGGTVETDPAKVRQLSEIDVMNVLAMVRKEFKIDDRRIYLMGHSMGGGGTLFLGEKYATNWAAIAAIAPAAFGFQPNSLAKIKHMPVMIVQGDADTMVQPAMTRRWVDELKALNMTYEYKEIAGGDHGSVITTGMPDIFKFFAKYSKPEPKAGESKTP